MRKLSVGIPTYNGSATISKVLDAIIIQIERYNLDVEILISDNASTDKISRYMSGVFKKIFFC